MKTNSQQGFAIVPILIVVVVVAACSLVGYKIYTNNQNKSVSKVSTQDTSTNDQVTATNPNGANESSVMNEKDSTEFVSSPNGSFSLHVPNTWNYRLCDSFEGIAFIEYGGDGTKNCRQSDAAYPEDGWYVHGRIVIGVGENGYPRPDGAVTKKVDLGNSITAEQNTYTTTVSKDNRSEVIINEYIIRKDSITITAKIFAGDFIDSIHPAADSKQLIQELEKALSTVIVKK